MAFTDEIMIYAKAGNGGSGVVRWLHVRGNEYAGPSGGDGGRGGSVYARAVRNVHLLSKYKAEKEFFAGRGEDGGSRSLHGGNGRDLDIEMPVGSVITNKRTGESYSLTEEGQRVRLLSGGAGGRGNQSFKSSTNRTPYEHTDGLPGEDGEFRIEVLLIADAGLIGLPNAGKTSLLNELTNAKGKVGAYPFTTIEPALGEMHGYILADIPGLIEGASEGKGLGYKFLRHIKRTRILVHLVSFENHDVTAAYKTVRRELAQYDEELAAKPELAVLTKTDLAEDERMLAEKLKELSMVAPEVSTLTVYDNAEIKKFSDMLIKKLKRQRQ